MDDFQEDRHPLPPMTDEERATLARMREAVKATILEIPEHDRYWRSSHCLRRFLAARGQKVEVAAAMYRETMAFRKARACGTLLQQGVYREPELLRRFFPTGFVGHDREGYPLLVENIGDIDLTGIASGGEEAFLSWVCWYHERQEALMGARSRAAGADRHKMTCIIDMGNVSARHLSSATLSVLKKRLRLEEDNYPEVARRVILIRTPALFSTVWSVVRHFVDEGTADKIQILGSDYMPTLLKFIDLDNIPAYMLPPGTAGGLRDERGDPYCRCYVAEGGIIPPAFITGVAADGRGAGEEVAIAAGKASALTLRVPAGATVRWKWAVPDKELVFAARAAPGAAGSSQAADGVIDVTKSAFGAHILAKGYPHPVQRGEAGAPEPPIPAARAQGPAFGMTKAAPGDGDVGNPYCFASAESGAVAALLANIPGAASSGGVELVAQGKADHGEGSWAAPTGGASHWIVRLAWDNAHSWMKGKTLCRRVDVLLPGEDEGAALRAADPGGDFARAREAHSAAVLASAGDMKAATSPRKPAGSSGSPLPGSPGKDAATADPAAA